MNVLLRLSLLFCFVCLFSCSSRPQQKKLAMVTDMYQAPANYTQHRQQQSFFTTGAGTLAYTDHGHGPVLVMLHGVPTSSWLFRKIIPELQKHYRVVSIDFLGYGSSDKPEDNGVNYLPSSQARYVGQLLHSLAIDEYALLMHDMGGLVAWQLLSARRFNITDMIIMNTIVTDKGFNPPAMKAGMITKAMTKAFASDLTSAAMLKATFKNLGLTGDDELTEMECHGYVEPLKEGADPALYAFFSSLETGVSTSLSRNQQLFDNYQGDTLVLWGALDDTLTTEQIPFLQKHLRIADENIHIYPDHHHFLMEEMPQEVIDQIKAFYQ